MVRDPAIRGDLTRGPDLELSFVSILNQVLLSIDCSTEFFYKFHKLNLDGSRTKEMKELFRNKLSTRARTTIV